ncbi:MAG: Na/Pi symporter [Planctomycetota bacterium]|jgi:sodium-dependent phosphate cotransporter
MEPGSGRKPARTTGPLTRPAPGREHPAWLRGIYAGVFLYLFLCAIKVMGSGLGTLGQSTTWIQDLLATADNPFVALMGAVLVTAIVQSSSFTTSLIITLVAYGEMKTQTAVFAVMGANIGTSVTNIIVALGNIRIRHQFRRAFTAALVHDIFNWLTVALLFPLEWITGAVSDDGHGVLSRFATWTAGLLGLEEVENPTSPITVITRPVVDAVNGAAGWIIPGDQAKTLGVVVAVAGLVLLFVSLVFMIGNLKGALLRQIERLFRSVFFRNDLFAYVVGAITTVLVQSSSVTTSLIVPLAGAGAVKLNRVYAYTLGANLGTTVTGVIAATANPVAAAVSVAIAHVTFNLIGTVIWYPLKAIPIGLAGWYGRLAARSKRYAFLFLFLVFVLIPLIGLVCTELLLALRPAP